LLNGPYVEQWKYDESVECNICSFDLMIVDLTEMMLGEPR
jgi:hypothetical protein